jgi:hypothetical protein
MNELADQSLLYYYLSIIQWQIEINVMNARLVLKHVYHQIYEFLVQAIVEATG